MNFVLSPALIDTLTSHGAGKNNVYAYAFAFGTSNGVAGQLLEQTTLVRDGHLGSQTFIDLPGPDFSSGQVYVIIQQGGDGSLPTHIANGTDGHGLNPVGVITPLDSQSNNYSYQLFEATLSGSNQDLGDISALNTFGFDATMQVVFHDNTTVSRGFRSSANTIFDAVGSGAVEHFSNNIFASSDNRLGIGPASITGDFPAADWAAYVTALKNHPAVLSDIDIVTPFTGSAFQDKPILSEYGVQYDSVTDSFWLVPNTSHGATNTDWMRIPASVLEANIYTQSTNLEIHHGGQNGPIVHLPIGTAPHTTGGFTPNIADGAVARDFVAGFDAGYWGGIGGSPNPKDPTIVDLNHNVNWNVNYAYNGTLNPGLVSYSNVLGSGPGTAGSNNRFYDPWAQAIQSSGNAYGWSFSDLVSAGGVNPQLTMWDPNQNTQVPTINIFLYDNGETPPNGSLQTPNAVYVAGPLPGGDYRPSLTVPTFAAPLGYASEIDFSFNFGVSTLNFAPANDTPISFKFYAPGGHGADPTSGFITLELHGPNSDWYNYNVVQNTDGSWSANAVGLEHPTLGSFSLFNLPTTSDGSVGWYQLAFGKSNAQTIYNLYATNGPSTSPTPPAEHTLASMVVDHAVSVTTTDATKNTPTIFTLNFAPGGNPTYEIANLALPGGWGDVHMTTFDGLKYDFQAVGDFVAVQSTAPDDPWQFQIRTASFPGASSITTGLAAVLGNVRVTFDLGRDDLLHLDGVSDILAIGELQTFSGDTLSRLSEAVYKLSWSGGESVVITDVDNVCLDWTVALGPNDGPGSIQGLLGGHSGQATDFKLPDGTILAQPNDDEILGIFANAWRVSPGTSLFDEDLMPPLPATLFPPAAPSAPAVIPSNLAPTDEHMNSQVSLTGGDGTATYVYGYGNDAITDLTAGPEHYLLLQAMSAFHNPFDVASQWSQSGSDMTTTNPNGGTLAIQSATVSYLTAH
jgi:hypothetical protein